MNEISPEAGPRGPDPAERREPNAAASAERAAQNEVSAAGCSPFPEPPAHLHRERTSRWASESRFFDRLASRIGEQLRPLPPALVERYRNPRRSGCNKEFRFQLLGDLRGKRVLDVGCGEGTNAVLMAKFGAHVTGVDISPGSIEICQRRAALEGVADRTQFLCSPLELVELPTAGFDVIWGDGCLHHLIPELPETLARLNRWARRGALFVFSEPVSLSRTLRKLRAHVPIHTDATPDERPLEPRELELVRRGLPGLELRWFSFLDRLSRFFLKGSFEEASAIRAAALDALWRLDAILLSIPKLRVFGSACVMYARSGPALPARGSHRARG